MSMALKTVGMIEIPDAAGSEFDHGAFDPATRRIFVAHTGRDRIEVIDHDAGKHIATLPGFPEAAGVVADDGAVLVTNRGAATLAWLDAHSLKTQAVFKTGLRPNGVAIVPQQGLAIVASIGDDHNGAKLEVFSRDGRHHALDLPGRPRWCVTDAATKRVFLAIRDPSMNFLSPPCLTWATWSTGGFRAAAPTASISITSAAGSMSHVTMARWWKSISAPVRHATSGPSLKIRT